MSKKKINKLALSSRYAKALLALALESGKQEKVKKDLGAIMSAISISPMLKKMLSNQMVARERFNLVFSEIIKKINGEALTRKFIETVVENKRVSLLPLIIKAYDEMLAKEQGEVSATVISATALDDEQVHKIQNMLAKNTGKKINIEKKVDSRILGGLIVKVGSRMVDNSLRGKLERLKISQQKTSISLVGRV